MLKELIGRNKGTIEIGSHKFYYKRNDAYVEVLVEQIEDLFGLHHAHYTPIMVEDARYYLSEDLNEIGPFITALDAGLESPRLDDIRKFVMSTFPDDFDRLMTDIIKMYFMDIMILNTDRHNDNWGFLMKDGTVNIYLLDNDLSFIHCESTMTSLEGNHRRDSVLEVYNIYETFPDVEIQMFNDMFNILDCNKLNEMIAKTEEEIGKELPYKDYYLKRFDLQRWSIEKIRDSYRLSKSIEQEKK